MSKGAKWVRRGLVFYPLEVDSAPESLYIVLPEQRKSQQMSPLMDKSCHFPTTVRKGVDNCCYRSILVFNHETMTTSWAQDHRSLKSLIQDAWAGLLRCYVRNDNVSFLSLSNPSERCDRKSTSARPCFGEGSEALVLQYRLTNNLILRYVHVSESEVVTVNGFEDLRVNTAVRFMSSCGRDVLEEDSQHPPSAGNEETFFGNVRHPW